ncbi:hypothetical protein EZH22_05950 [Xanthobacter dioxanivorans]|uniref:Uncharacterized protein n=1 Tax=Xanthobacter dioxanivorans TaxID=2528964 RepID=A0A974PR81_9HYPH|nr:hypothetical protein [Xanthobacter dioxanivorans]QRG07909.1 hypothetical protein EZH22_05950 [Xanthobacter dioxanivorans]
MSKILRFPGPPNAGMTYAVERDFSQWCVVHRRRGKFVKRTFCEGQAAAEALADTLRLPEVAVPDSVLHAASYDDDGGAA